VVANHARRGEDTAPYLPARYDELEMKLGHLEIKTPEGIVFSQPLAGPVTRFLAWMLDLFCISLLLMIVRFATGVLMLLSVDIAAALNVFMYFVVSIGYGIVLEWFWRGQTLGKRLVRIRVVGQRVRDGLGVDTEHESLHRRGA